MALLLPRPSARLSLVLWLAVAAVGACSSSAAPPVVPAGPSPSVTSSYGSHDEAPVESWAVRCGIDDRPRPVSVGTASAAGRLAHATPAHAAAVCSRASPPPPDPTVPVPPAVRVERLPLTASDGGPSPVTLLGRGPDDDACLSLARFDEPLDPLTFELELASNGAPLRVRPASPGVASGSRLARCLLERTCQLQAAGPIEPVRLRGSVRLQPRERLPRASRTGLDVETLAPLTPPDALQTQLRELVADVLAPCGAQAIHAQARLRVFFVPGPVVLPPGSPRVGPSLRAPTVRGFRTEALAGTLPDSVRECLGRGLTHHTFGRDTVVPSGGDESSEWLLLTWRS